jgi:Flp pilus assembly pilin Flp
MTNLMTALLKEEAGFIVSAELILVATIAVLAMVVGLSEIALNINNELEDVASAFGSVNQSYRYGGLKGHQADQSGSGFGDRVDFCDGDQNIVCDNSSTGEAL